MKPIWSGSISFGLVTIPIQLYQAVQEHIFGFTILCEKCHNPLHYSRWCDHCKKEVTWNQVVKGIEIKKGKYLVLTPEMIKKLKPEKSSAISILEFIPIDLIEPIYFEHHYYVAPQGGEKAYFLFCKALKEMKKAAIGQFVMRDKEYVVAIQAYDKGMLLSTLNYAYEIRAMEKIPQLSAKKVKLQANELQLAKQLIEKLSKKEFDISKFKDNYVENLKKLIKQGSKGKRVKIPAPAKEPKKAHSLMDALKDSVAHARA